MRVTGHRKHWMRPRWGASASIGTSSRTSATLCTPQRGGYEPFLMKHRSGMIHSATSLRFKDAWIAAPRRSPAGYGGTKRAASTSAPPFSAAYCLIGTADRHPAGSVGRFTEECTKFTSANTGWSVGHPTLPGSLFARTFELAGAPLEASGIASRVRHVACVEMLALWQRLSQCGMPYRDFTF